MKKFLWLICLPGLIFTIPGFALAEEKEKETEVIKLEEIVVTAIRTDKKLVETPASITIITAEEIEEMGAKNIVDVVENIPGVVDDSTTRDEVTFRGNRSPQSPGALVLVDGVPANTGLGNYVDYDAIPLSDIERVEVLRSSGSIAFGPDAARGMINIITKKGKAGPPQIQFSASYGSWNTVEESANITGRIADWDYGFGGSRLDTDSYEDDQKRRSAARLGFGYNFSDDTRLGFNLAWREVDYETIYNKKTKWQLEHYRHESIFPKSDTDSTLVHHREHNDENIATSLEFRHEGDNFFGNSLVSYDHTDHLYEMLENHLDPANIKKDYKEDQDQDRFLARISGGYHFCFGEIKYSPTLGVDYEKTDFDQNRTYPWADAAYLATRQSTIAKANLDYERERWGFFLANELHFSENWELNLSGRVDDVEYDVKNKQPKRVTKNHTDYSWNVTPAFHPTVDSTIYASASRSYWSPVAYYYKYAMEYGDEQYRPEDLEAEESLTYELGYKHYFGSKLSLALAGYFMEVKNKFLSYYDVTNTWRGYFNVGTADYRGVELEATGRLYPFFGYRLSAAYQDAEWDEGIFRCYKWGATPANDVRDRYDIKGKKVIKVPELTYTLGFDFYFLDYFKFSADVNYYDSQYVDMLNQYETDDYATVDALLSYKRGNYRVWVLSSNLFDAEKENLYNETGHRLADGPDQRYYPIDGRYMEVGVTFNF